MTQGTAGVARGAATGAVTVAIASGDTTGATDTAAINAAFLAAGNGGVVSFPANQIYIVNDYPANVAIVPRIIDGNGSTIKLRNQVATTIASGTVSAGTTSTTVTSSAGIVIGSTIIMQTGTTRSNTMIVYNVVGNVLTHSAASFETGTTLTTGATVVVCDECLYIAWQGTNAPCEISGLTFDGNLTNRTVGRNYIHSLLLDLSGDSSTDGSVWVHHCVIQNAPCDGFGAHNLPHVKLTNNHFENCFGSGAHSGSSSLTKNMVIADNTFTNCYQSTSATSPSSNDYGHVAGAGAITSSNGPVYVTVTGNVVDTSTGFGCDTSSSTLTHSYVVNGNIFKDCNRGGFRARTASADAVFNGNLIYNCGHDTLEVTDPAGYKEITGIHTSPGARASITGNIFVNSCMLISGDSSSIVVFGNYFNNVTKTKGTRETASIILEATSTGDYDLVLSGNIIVGPRNNTEYLAVSSLPLDGIYISEPSKNISMDGNTIVGGRNGIYISGDTDDTNISNNVLIDQFSSSGAFATGVFHASSTTKYLAGLVRRVYG